MILTTRKIAKIPKNPKHDRRFSNVKLFGKKTLALALALTMVLSLCSFTAMAEGTTPGTGNEGSDPATVPATGIELDQTSLTLTVGQNATLQATVKPDNATDKTVTWRSSDETKATVSNGTVTGVAAGAVTIYAECGAAKAECNVTVNPQNVPVTEIKITASATTLVVGKDVTFTANVTPENATDKTVTWSSSAPAVATVDQSGKVKALTAGTTYIKAEAGEKSDSVTVTVVENNIVAVNTATQSKTLDYGKTLAQVKAELAKIEWSVKYGNETNKIDGTATIPASGWTSANFVEKKAGQFAFTGSFGTGLDVTVNVTISQGTVSSVPSLSFTVYKGTLKDTVIAKTLPSKVNVTLTGGATEEFSIGTNGDFRWECANYNAATPATYIFTAVANTNDAAVAHFANVSMNSKTITAQVTVSAAYNLPISETLYYNRNTSSSINLESTVRDAVNAAIKTRLGVTTTSVAYKNMVSMTCDKNTYGKLGTGTYAYTYTADSSKFTTSRTMEEKFTYSALDTDGVTYSGTITLTVTSSTFDVSDATTTSDPIVYFSGSSGIANKIAEAYKARYGSTPTYIDFGSIGRNDDELGELRDGNGDSVEDGTYTFASKDEDYDSVSNIYFVPTGVGGTFDIEYTAYTGSSSKRQSMTGTISIKCDEMLVVWLSDMGAGETQNLSASAIQEQVTEILDTNKISYTLDTVSLNRPSTGTIYDGSNKKITTKTVDAEDLDDYTYEAPAKVTSANLVTIRFSVKCKPDSGKSTKTASGVMLFNLTKKADITISAPANDAAVLGTDVFQTYFEKNASSTYRKNYDACYVVFSGAPNSNTSGYLYDGYKSGIINGSKIKSPNGKKFALTDISAHDKNAYDLSNTYYVPGSRNCTGGTFEIYGVKSGTTIKSSTRFTKLCEGSIDYVVGSAAAAITGTINASNYMQMTPSAFTKTNKNASYVVFTAQPTGGKLVYNYNRTTPGVVKEISLNTPYYITYSAANANYYLGYVSFVPAYTAVKGVTSVIDIPCTIYSSSKTGTAASVKISVVSATKSAKFTDVGVAYMPYADSIDFLYNCGITTGTSTTGSLYNPSGSVTRGEWITMLYRAAGSPKMSNKIPFTDVTATNSYSWCYDAVRWAYQNNICQGTGATTFSPAMKLDRQQIVTFMYNYAVKYNGGNGAGSSINGYTDSASVASWAKAPMEWAVKNQYYTVVGTRLQPTDSANRAEVALYMHRLLTY